MLPDFLTEREFYRSLGIILFFGSSLLIVVTAYLRKKRLRQMHPDLDVMIDISKADMAKENGYPVTVEIAGTKTPLIIHSFIKSFKIVKGKHFNLSKTLARFTVDNSGNVVQYKKGVLGRDMSVDIAKKKISLRGEDYAINEFGIRDKDNRTIIQFLSEKDYPHQIIGKIQDESNPNITDLTIGYLLYQLRADLMHANLLVKEPSAAYNWIIAILVIGLFLAAMIYVYVIEGFSIIELFGPDPYDRPIQELDFRSLRPNN